LIEVPSSILNVNLVPVRVEASHWYTHDLKDKVLAYVVSPHSEEK
jgi:hypothetical protein